MTQTKNKLIETSALLAIDCISIIISYEIALFLRFDIIGEKFPRDIHNLSTLYLIIICILYNLIFDPNRNFFKKRYYMEILNIIKYVVALLLVLIVMLYFNQATYDLSRMVFTCFAIANCILTFGGHMLFKRYMVRNYRHSGNSNKVIILTEQTDMDEILSHISNDNAWDYQVTAIAVMDADMVGKSINGIPIIANKESLYNAVKQITLDEVFIHLPDYNRKQLKELIHDLESMGITCHVNVDVPELNMAGKRISNFAGYTVLSFSLQQFDFRKMLIKRFIDIIGGSVGLLGTIILFPFIALAIKIESKGPIIFAQTRVGKNGRRFKIYKFRSMYIDAEERKKKLMDQNQIKGLMFKMENDPRITKVGAFIRKTSLDELPQFFNIVKGDMSLIGTRPPTMDEFEQYSLYYRRRLSITPGLTGMWQISGRSDIMDFDEVVKLDLEYIDNWSLWLDFKIILQTIKVVLITKGSR
ncbi:MAG: sugar transferase [Eubacteriales bacterium]